MGHGPDRADQRVPERTPLGIAELGAKLGDPRYDRIEQQLLGLLGPPTYRLAGVDPVVSSDGGEWEVFHDVVRQFVDQPAEPIRRPGA